MYNAIFQMDNTHIYYGILPAIHSDYWNDYFNVEHTHRLSAEEIGQLMGGN